MFAICRDTFTKLPRSEVCGVLSDCCEPDKPAKVNGAPADKVLRTHLSPPA